jgi:hypothetical protein
VLSIAPILLIAKDKSIKSHNEINVLLRNLLYLNKVDFSNYHNYMTCKNTFGQTLGLEYTRVSPNGLLLSAGIGLGYERYKFSMNAPFNQTGPQIFTTGGPGNIDRTTHVSNINLTLGYRFKPIKKIIPELRIGASLMTALNGFDLYTLAATNDDAYTRHGNVGKLQSFSMEPIGHIYFGCLILSKSAVINRLKVGIELQREITKDNPFNYFEAVYVDYANNISISNFMGRHTAIGIQIAYKL